MPFCAAQPETTTFHVRPHQQYMAVHLGRLVEEGDPDALLVAGVRGGTLQTVVAPRRVVAAARVHRVVAAHGDRLGVRRAPVLVLLGVRYTRDGLRHPFRGRGVVVGLPADAVADGQVGAVDTCGTAVGGRPVGLIQQFREALLREPRVQLRHEPGQVRALGQLEVRGTARHRGCRHGAPARTGGRGPGQVVLFTLGFVLEAVVRHAFVIRYGIVCGRDPRGRSGDGRRARPDRGREAGKHRPGRHRAGRETYSAGWVRHTRALLVTSADNRNGAPDCSSDAPAAHASNANGHLGGVCERLTDDIHEVRTPRSQDSVRDRLRFSSPTGGPRRRRAGSGR